MSHFLQTANSYIGIVTVIGLVLFGIGYAVRQLMFGGRSFDNQAIVNLQAAMAGLEKENQLVKEENNRLREEMKAQVLKHASLESDMKVLQAMATGAPAIDGFAQRFEIVIAGFQKDIEEFRAGQKAIIDLLTKRDNTKVK